MYEKNEKTAINASYFSLLGNILLAIIKAFAGYFGNSYALIADAIESTSDVISSFFLLLGLRYAKKPADDNHPYGHGKIEPLITFMIVVFLIGTAFFIALRAIHNINSEQVAPEIWTVPVLLLIIAWKEFSFRYVIKKSRATQSSALKADAWHHRSDAISSLTALVGITLALLLGEGYEQLDDWAALVASGIILYNSYFILRPALSEIMDEDRYKELTQKIKKELLKNKEVKTIESCHIRKSGFDYHIDLHILIDGEKTVQEAYNLNLILKQNLIQQMPEIKYISVYTAPCVKEGESNINKGEF